MFLFCLLSLSRFVCLLARLHYITLLELTSLLLQLKYRTHWIICVFFFSFFAAVRAIFSLALFLSPYIFFCMCVWYCYCFPLSSTYSFSSLFRLLNYCVCLCYNTPMSEDRNKTNADSKTTLTATHTHINNIRKNKNEKKISTKLRITYKFKAILHVYRAWKSIANIWTCKSTTHR